MVSYTEAKKALNRVRTFDENSQVFGIHYANSGFTKDGESPKIVSIAVKSLSSKNEWLFSLSEELEERNIRPTDASESDFIEAEKDMLKNFSGFLVANERAKWLTWNMHKANFGFQAISHRAKLLFKDEYEKLNLNFEIMDENIMHMSMVVSQIYGDDYADHPKLMKLRELNKIESARLLEGRDEVKAFSTRELGTINDSVTSKVTSILTIYKLTRDKRLKVKKWALVKGTKWVDANRIFHENSLLMKVIETIVTMIIGALIDRII